MMESAKVIDPGVSTADADYPKLCQVDDNLNVTFTDWRELEVEIIFVNAIAFRWHMVEEYIQGEEYDRCHIIENSKWLENHYKQKVVDASESYNHYKFNFNACGQLDVLAGEIKIKT